MESSLASLTELIGSGHHGLEQQTADIQQIIEDLDEIQHTLDLLANTTGHSQSASFLSARRYPSAGTSYGPVSVSVCLSQVGVLSKWMDGSSWFLAFRLLSTYTTRFLKDIHMSTRIRAFPSATLSKTQDLENFASAYRSSKRAVNLARERWRRSESDKLTVVGQLT